jgi:phosphoribosyl 1,2-cyclic phosphodiesterase
VALQVKLWGVRGSIPVPGGATAGFGGNTACVQVTSGDGGVVILDAGTGIRELSATLTPSARPIHILVTHLHLDHIVGLGFFAPFFDAAADVTIWGPPDGATTLAERVARYISDPLSPLEIRELPAHVTFADVPASPWHIGGVEVRASLVTHRGPTLGYRLATDGVSLCYLPDHEPRAGQDLTGARAASLSGHQLAHSASLLIHDCQYADAEYPGHRGWGHSCVSDALLYARRCEAKHLVLFHHDPWHDDAMLESMWQDAEARWGRLGGEGPIEMAREGHVITLGT